MRAATKSCKRRSDSANDVFAVGHQFQVDRVDAQVSGTGDRNGNVIVIQGSVHAVGNSTEVITVGGGGGPNV